MNQSFSGLKWKLLRVNPSTNRVYVPDFASNAVRVIDGATNTVITTITVRFRPIGIGVNPSTNRIFVAVRFTETDPCQLIHVSCELRTLQVEENYSTDQRIEATGAEG